MGLPKIVRLPIWAVFRTVSRSYLMLRNRGFRYVFILGHMRSGSTLLAHILASHPDIAGAGETHLLYRTPADLPKLVLTTAEFLHKPILRETYIVDQINHDYITDDVLLAKDVYRCIILLREPEATLKSMAALKRLNSEPWQETQALRNYVNRLEMLSRYASVLGQRASLVDYDDLVDHTEETLAALTKVLDLDPPLSPYYATHRMTGRVAGIGDPSENIKTGRIIRTPKHEIAISEETLIAATTAYRKCREKLRTITKTVDDEVIIPNKSSSISA
jgi:Sulfotransferase family